MFYPLSVHDDITADENHKTKNKKSTKFPQKSRSVLYLLKPSVATRLSVGSICGCVVFRLRGDAQIASDILAVESAPLRNGDKSQSTSPLSGVNSWIDVAWPDAPIALRQ